MQQVLDGRELGAVSALQRRRFKKPPKQAKTHRERVASRLMMPGIIVTAIITQIPFLGTLYYSFFSWNIMRPDLGLRFVWFQNFAQLLGNAQFYEALWNTILLTGISLLVCIVCGMFLALLLNRQFVGRGFVRTLMISPFFVMPAVTGILWKDMIFNPSFGLLAWLTHVFGIQAVDVAATHPLFLVIFIVSWEWTPFVMLVLLAGLQSFPDELTESALLDGASSVQRFVYLVVPHLMRYLEVALFLGLVYILQTFGEIYVATQGGPGFASTNLSFLVYMEQVQDFQYGMASAVAVLIVIVTVVAMAFFFRRIRKSFGETLS